MKKFKKYAAALLVVAVSVNTLLFSGCTKTEPPPAPETTQEQPEPAEETPETPPEETQSQEPAPERLVDKPADEVTFAEKLHDLLLGAREFYEDSQDQAVLISQNGMLYNALADLEVTPAYLAQRGYIGEAYLLPDSSVLYLAPDAVAAALGDYNGTGNRPELFVAAKADAAYSLITAGSSMFNATADEFAALMAQSAYSHGEVRRITGATPDYAQINDAIQAYENGTSDYFIRYGLRDDKYGIVIASPKDQYEVIHGFVFSFADGTCSIVKDNLEDIVDSAVAINEAFPDLNAALIPPYDLSRERKKLQTDFEGMTDALIDDGYINATDAEKLKYACANDEIMFAKFENNQMFIGIKQSGVWILGEVDSAENARNRFISLNPKAADFILIWE